MELLITVDVEGGSRSDPYLSVDAFDTMLVEMGTETTLFVTPDVVKHRPDTINRWRRAGHAIGLHIHPSRFGENTSDWLTEYDQNSIEGMLQQGIYVFERDLGFRPQIFRAGRWEYSEKLLRALNNCGFIHDASLSPVQRNTSRSPARYRKPYKQHGIEEFPVTVYENAVAEAVLRPFPINCIPLDLSSFLTQRRYVLGFYLVTWWLLQSNLPYLMVAFHDFDTDSEEHGRRIRRYIDWLARSTTPVGLHSS